jgi:hypothetical protein
MSNAPNPNPHAKAMADRRWSKKTPAERMAHSLMMSKARLKQAKAARQKKGLA